MKIIDGKKLKKSQLIAEAAKVLEQDGLIVVPSDTVYGLSVNSQSKQAVDKLLEFKDRPKGKPISIFVGNIERAGQYIKTTGEQLAVVKKLTPGPYTVVLQSKGKVDSRLESEVGTLGIRLPDFLLINELVAFFGKPITATSANPAGDSPHYSVQSLLNSLSEKKKLMIDLIVDYGPLPRNKPSTVIDLTQDQLKILRAGDAIPETSLISNSETETRKIAADFVKEQIDSVSKKPLVVILQGELGAGKTVFVKGIGGFLGIDDIISPTFVVCYEYQSKKKPAVTLHHCDFYNIQEKDELQYLGLEKMLLPGNIICIEWGEKSGDIFDKLKKKAEICRVILQHKTQTKRKISIQKL